MEDYALARISSHKALADVLGIVFESHELLRAGFWKNVRVAFKNSKYSLVPASLFDPEYLYDYLQINSKVDPEEEEAIYYKHIQCDAVNVFAVNRQLLSFFRGHYPNIEVGFLHQSTALIEGILTQVKNHPKNTIFTYIDRFKLHIISVKNGKLEYYNQFIIKQFSDYVKYIMLVMQGLKRNQKTSNIVIWGYIGRNSPHYNEFYKFIKDISFGDRLNHLKFGYMFDEVQDHHFFDLYSLFLCD